MDVKPLGLESARRDLYCVPRRSFRYFPKSITSHILLSPQVHLVALVNLIGEHSSVMEKLYMTELVQKLHAIGGSGPLKMREWRIRTRLNWHTKAASAVRHLLYRERAPSLEEAKQIEAAHLKYCAERINANAAENASLLREMQSALAAMEQSDPEFFEPTLEAVRQLLFQRWNQSGETGDKG